MSAADRQVGRHHRRSAPQGRSPRAGRLARPRRAAVRLLPDRPDHAGGGLAGQEAGADRRRDHRAPWPATSAGAAAISAFTRPCAPLPGGRDMTELDTHSKFKIANVSRRGLLKGVAATGGLVLAAQFPAVKGALAAYPTGADAMPNGVVSNPKVFISIGGDGTVSIVAARAEMGNGAARTALPMMLADELEADWARVRVVQSPGDERTYGNQDTDGSRSVRHWIQPMRQCGAAMRTMLEQAAAAEWKVRVSEVQAQLHEVVHKPSGRKLGYGELAGAARRPAGAGRRQGQAQGGERLPLHRQGHRAHRRPARHHHRQGDLRPGRHAARHEVRRHRQAAGGRRQGGVARFQRGPEGAGRGEDRHAAADAGALQVRAAGRRGRHRPQHLGRDQGPRGAQDHLGRRAEQGLRLQGLPGAARGRREEARQGRAQRRRRRQGAGLGGQGDHGRVLCARTSTTPPWSRRPRPRG